MRFSSTTTTTIKTPIPTPTTVPKQYANAVLAGTGIMCSTLLELSVDDPSFHKNLMEAVTRFSIKLLGASYHGWQRSFYNPEVNGKPMDSSIGNELRQRHSYWMALLTNLVLLNLNITYNTF